MTAENSVMGPWRTFAAVLVVGLSVLFTVLFTRERRRIRSLLRNRLAPLVLSEERHRSIVAPPVGAEPMPKPRDRAPRCFRRRSVDITGHAVAARATVPSSGDNVTRPLMSGGLPGADDPRPHGRAFPDVGELRPRARPPAIADGQSRARPVLRVIEHSAPADAKRRFTTLAGPDTAVHNSKRLETGCPTRTQ